MISPIQYSVLAILVAVQPPLSIQLSKRDETIHNISYKNKPESALRWRLTFPNSPEPRGLYVPVVKGISDEENKNKTTGYSETLSC